MKALRVATCVSSYPVWLQCMHLKVYCCKKTNHSWIHLRILPLASNTLFILCTLWSSSAGSLPWMPLLDVIKAVVNGAAECHWTKGQTCKYGKTYPRWPPNLALCDCCLFSKVKATMFWSDAGHHSSHYSTAEAGRQRGLAHRSKNGKDGGIGASE